MVVKDRKELTPPESPVRSPLSPPNFDNTARPSMTAEGPIIPRLRALETHAQVQATELALLRQLGDDVAAWRYRVDSASTQTAHVLQALNNDLEALKTCVYAFQSGNSAVPADHAAVDSLVSEMQSCYAQLQDALGRIDHNGGQEQSAVGSNDRTSVSSRLREVESQLVAAQAFIAETEDQSSMLTREIQDLRSSMADVSTNAAKASVEAAMAGEDAAAAARSAALAAAETASLAGQIQALRLGLDVVEQSLEDLDLTDALAALRSRVDDLDAGIENTANRALESLHTVEEAVQGLRRDLERVDEATAQADARASNAEQLAIAARQETAELRHIALGAAQEGTKNGDAGSDGSSTRVKAAVQTLSDGYRSLHRAMTLMYEEQADVAGRVATVGIAAAAEMANWEKPVHVTKKMINVNSRSKSSLQSHSLKLTSALCVDDEDAPTMYQTVDDAMHVSELRALVAAQAKDLAHQTRHAERLEAEIVQMRQLLRMLAPLSNDSESLSDDLDAMDLPTAEESTLVDGEVDTTVAMDLMCDEKTGCVTVSVAPEKVNTPSVEDEELSWRIRADVP